MKLRQLLDPLAYTLAQGNLDADILDLTDDSRQVKPGSLFIARAGHASSGQNYIGDAIAQGAIAILATTPPAVGVATPQGQPVTWVVTPALNQAVAGQIAQTFFDHPDRKLSLIGITGTNGKTTTAFLIRHLLETAGMHCGMIGTISIDDGRNVYPAELTTPGAIEFVRLLATMVNHGCQAVVAEVSSHALHQGRVAGLTFRVGIFTNLTGDHLDYHHTMDQYADAKAILFDHLPADAFAILNADDPYAQRIARDCKAHLLWCTLADLPAAPATGKLTQAGVVKLEADHSIARFDGPWGSVEAKLPLVGRHNIANTLQAIAAANAVTAQSRTLARALADCPAPGGRLEPVSLPDADPRHPMPVVLVDYAHTHDALENVLNALRPICQGRLITLFGCGGDRDKTKRPKMAHVACVLSDQVVITLDNPRTEDPAAIINDILVGVPTDRRSIVTVEPDRAAAIAQVIAGAGPRDIVLLAGKGHEDYQIIGRTKRHFDDRQHALGALERRRQASAPCMKC